MTEIPGYIQQSTAADEHTSTEKGSAFQNNVNEQSPAICIIIVQSLIGSVTIIGNLLLMWVVYNLKNSKLRDGTRLLICYVSASHIMLSILLMARLAKLPCFLFLAGISNGGINVGFGMFHLAFETFIVVKKPYDHKWFVSIKICRIKIAISCLIALCINVMGYITMKEPHNSSFCYASNGQFHAPRLALYFSLFMLLIIVTSSLQICTLKELSNVHPIGTQRMQSAISSVHVMAGPTVDPAPAPAISGTAQNRNIRKSPLHKLMIILSVSFLCFFMCFMPIVTSNVVFSVCELLGIQIDMKQQISTGLCTLVTINGSLHVLVYFVMSTQIRQGMKMLIKSWLHLC